MSTREAPPVLLYILGPPAVGKMAVGAEVSQRTGLLLFHAHMTIDLVLRFFAFGSDPFNRLVGEFRQRIFDEVAGSGARGLIFTSARPFDRGAILEELAVLAQPFVDRGGRVLHVELAATLEERLRRNETPLRLAEKPSRRDVVRSKSVLLQLDERHRFNSDGEFDGREDYLRIDNTDLSADDVANRIVGGFGLDAV